MKVSVDFCVVGGGIAGLCAAVAAARHGATVALVQDRSVLGGNASSEIRMHICGAHGSNRRETGIVEELFLDNLRYNSSASWPIFDTVLWSKVRAEKNIRLFLDSSVSSGTVENGRLRSVRAWQTTTEEWIEIEAKLFADCSGDSVLAPISGAAFRWGREGRDEFGESEAPEKPDSCTMGNSILLQAMEFPTEQPFTPFPWAYDYSAPENREWLNGRWCDITRTNLWWIEVGGMGDCIKDTAEHRDELLKICYGVWDYVKNHAPDKERWRNFGLEWVGSLPGKRESRRYEGDHMMTQREVQDGGRFEDIVAYGGWSIDNHYPEGFYHRGEGTKYTGCPSPFGIPFRSLYSRNVPNLLFAGRNISCSHVAMSATRVMATCGLEGQAIGIAAAIAVRDGLEPRAIYETRMEELQRTLQDDDCWIPGKLREVRGVCANAKLEGAGEGVERLRDGMERDYDDGEHGWRAPFGSAATYLFEAPVDLHEIRLVFDSDLNRADKGRPQGTSYDSIKQGRFFRALGDPCYCPPKTLVRDFRIEVSFGSGEWVSAAEVKDNFQRLVRIPVEGKGVKGLRLVPLSAWGATEAHVFAFDAR